MKNIDARQLAVATMAAKGTLRRSETPRSSRILSDGTAAEVFDREFPLGSRVVCLTADPQEDPSTDVVITGRRRFLLFGERPLERRTTHQLTDTQRHQLEEHLREGRLVPWLGLR